MSDHPYYSDLSLIQIAVRVGMACAVTVVAAVGTFAAFRLLAG
jgi:hypothetical protein